MNREEKSRLSKDSIMKAAFTLFSEKGYENTSTQDIIEKTGLSRGALYHHFKGKEEILRSITEDFHAETQESLRNLVSTQGMTACKKISVLIRSGTENYVRKQLIHCSWIEKIPFALLEELRSLNNSIAPCIARILKQGVEHQEFVCAHPEALAELLVFYTDVLLDPVLFHRTPEEVCNRLDFVADILTRMNIPVISAEDIQILKSSMTT